MDVVIRTPHGEAEITIARAGGTTAIADIVEHVTGSAAPPTADVDGQAILTTATINGAGLHTGSVIDLGPSTRTAAPDAVLELVQVAGWGAGARRTLGPGTYRIGPGRRVHAADLDLAGVDQTAFEVTIDSDGGATVTVDEAAVRIDGIGVEVSAPWPTGILDVAGRAFVLDRDFDRTDPLARAPTVESSGLMVFNRPPRLARAPIPPPLVAPDGSPGSDQDTRVAFLAEVMERRGAERERRHDLFPHAALAMRLAGTAPTRLWSSRPGDDGAFEIAIGLGDIVWRPELSPGTGPTAGPDSVLAELGPLPMVPVTVDLRHERGVGFVGSTEFTRAAVRGLLVEACVRYGPADLDVVVLTDPDRAPMWEWVKWLPHNRASGVARSL